MITRNDVLMHSLTIVWLFGVRAYFRSLRAAFSAEPSTFLEAGLRVPTPVVGVAGAGSIGAHASGALGAGSEN